MKKVISISLALVMLIVVIGLAGCTANTPDSVAEKLEKAGYEVILENSEVFCRDSEDFFEIAEGTFIAQIKATKGDDYVYIYYCENAEAAQCIYDMTEELYLQADQEQVADHIYEINGSTVYLGTESGINAAK